MPFLQSADFLRSVQDRTLASGQGVGGPRVAQ
jgi:hypothetical protein